MFGLAVVLFDRDCEFQVVNSNTQRGDHLLDWHSIGVYGHFNYLLPTCQMDDRQEIRRDPIFILAILHNLYVFIGV